MDVDRHPIPDWAGICGSASGVPDWLIVRINDKVEECMADIIIGTIVFGILGSIVYRMLRAAKKGKSSCGQGCSGCPYACDGLKKH